MKLRPPTDEQFESKIGLAVATRAIIHRGHLSLVERIRLRESVAGETVILKTVCPALAHERHVHAAVQDYTICAPALLAADDADDDHDAWLLLSDVGEISPDEVTVDQAAQALVELAAVHRAYLGADLSGIPRRDLSWLARQAEETAERLVYLARRRELNLDEESIHLYCDRLQVLAQRHAAERLTVVHGDFDPGNLVRLTTGQFAALDWGLGHLNTPLVDFAHMTERFTSQEQDRLGLEFTEALGLPQRIDAQLLDMGLVAHRAFFVWWHSLIVAEGWAPIEDFQHSIATRIGSIASSSTD